LIELGESKNSLKKILLILFLFFSCNTCEERFNSHAFLDQHKSELNHWSDDEIPFDSQDEDPDSLRDCMNDSENILEELADKDDDEIEREFLLL